MALKIPINKSEKSQEAPEEVVHSPSRNTVVSSVISQGAVVAAKDYLMNVYSNATKPSGKSSSMQNVPAKALNIDDTNLPEFIKEISEESARNQGNIHS